MYKNLEKIISLLNILKMLKGKMVELDGIEPTTSCLQSRRSPN